MQHIIRPFDNRIPHTKVTFCGLTILGTDITKYEAEKRIINNHTKSICKRCIEYSKTKIYYPKIS